MATPGPRAGLRPVSGDVACYPPRDVWAVSHIRTHTCMADSPREGLPARHCSTGPIASRPAAYSTVECPTEQQQWERTALEQARPPSFGQRCNVGDPRGGQLTAASPVTNLNTFCSASQQRRLMGRFQTSPGTEGVGAHVRHDRTDHSCVPSRAPATSGFSRAGPRIAASCSRRHRCSPARRCSRLVRVVAANSARLTAVWAGRSRGLTAALHAYFSPRT